MPFVVVVIRARGEDKDKAKSKFREMLREGLKRERKKMKGDFMDHLKRQQQQGKLGILHHHLIIESLQMQARDLRDKIDLFIRIHMKKLKHFMEEDSQKLALEMHKMSLKNMTLAEDSDKLALGVHKMSLHD